MCAERDFLGFIGAAPGRTAPSNPGGPPNTSSPRRRTQEPTVPVLANIIGPELLIVLAVVALLFGSSRLPHLARSLGSAKNEFERGLREEPGRDEPARDEPARDEQSHR